ncbi:inorganic phosphate transporter 1-1-like [Setaria italica]|uniref:inorganic phosphate transporter 1-1-like n=1 Tax=Setaria italica TaxID=4555 RepID=UPI000646AFF0|nr:inorganic phosphate transporter 1-1-like [Setaria italica]
MPETARYTALVERNAKQASADMSWVLHTEIKESAAEKTALAAGVEWGLLSAWSGAVEELFRIAHAQALIALCGTIPGYWFTVDCSSVLRSFTQSFASLFW